VVFVRCKMRTPKCWNTRCGVPGKATSRPQCVYWMGGLLRKYLPLSHYYISPTVDIRLSISISTTSLQSVTIVNFFPISPTLIVRWSTTVTYNLYSGRRLIDGAEVSVFRIAGVWCAYRDSASQIGIPYAHVRCTYIY
jgi:hypothetical protein